MDEGIDDLKGVLADRKKAPPAPAPAPAPTPAPPPKKEDPVEMLMADILAIQMRGAERAKALDLLAETQEVGGFVFEMAAKANEARTVKEMCQVFGITPDEFYASYEIGEEEEEDEDAVDEDYDIIESDEEEEAAPTKALPLKSVEKKKKKGVLDTDEEFVKG